MKKIAAVLLFTLLSLNCYAKDYNVDLAIIGGGWSGLIAGVAAGEAGLKTVILEKMPATGGGGNWVGVTSAFGTPGVTGLDEAYTTYMDFTHSAPNSLLIRRLMNEIPNNVQWLIDHGVKFVDFEIFGGRVRIFAEDGGATIMANFITRLNKMENVTILTETPAKQLIVAKNGAVNGVIAENTDGETVRVNAKNTIIATGPIVGNPEMLKKYMPYLNDGYKVEGPSGRTGDGITLALQADARIDSRIGLDSEAAHNFNPTNRYIMTKSKDQEAHALHIAANLPYLRVNKFGKRFMNESLQDPQSQAHALSFNNNVYWLILDEELKNRLINEGLDAMGISITLVPMYWNAPKLSALDSGLEKAYKNGYAYKANTIEDLAKLIKVDPKTLRATVDMQNEFAKNKYDADFLKTPNFLHVYNKGPFYAIKGEHTILSSTGGIQCNENLQVIRDDLSVIQGLYVTGSIIGSTEGDTSPMQVAAGTGGTGFSISASRLIVQHIVSQK
jgi:fumarate reductase flavoprotein subunit